MREVLSDKVAYFERDLVAYALPSLRVLHIYEEPIYDKLPAPVSSAGKSLQTSCVRSLPYLS
jgi:hypothetical protein